METITIPTPFELTIELTDEQFFQLCQNNRDLRFERSARAEAGHKSNFQLGPRFTSRSIQRI